MRIAELLASPAEGEAGHVAHRWSGGVSHEGLGQGSWPFDGTPVGGRRPQGAAASFLSPGHAEDALPPQLRAKAEVLRRMAADFRETELWWQSRRLVRRHLRAEAFGVGAFAGGLVWWRCLPAPAAPACSSKGAAAATAFCARRGGARSGAAPGGAPPQPPKPKAQPRPREEPQRPERQRRRAAEAQAQERPRSRGEPAEDRGRSGEVLRRGARRGVGRGGADSAAGVGSGGSEADFELDPEGEEGED